MKLGILGASGRTGRLLVEQALAAGHSVRALVRSPDRLSARDPRLELLIGDVHDADVVARLAEGCDAVLSALGPAGDVTDACSVAARHVIRAGVKRYVSVSGAGIDVPGDEKDLVGRVVSFFVRIAAPAAFQDKVTEHALLAESSIAWTLVRPPRLVDRAGTGAPRMRLDRSPGSMLARSDLAAFVLRSIEDEALVRRAPFVAA